MRKLWFLLFSILFFIGVSKFSQSADNIIVPPNSGKAYMEDNSGNLFPASVVYTTDGDGNIQPVFSSDATITVGTVVQGSSNDGSSPWNVQDTAFKTDFDTWKTWADVNLSTVATDSHLQTFSGKFTNTSGGAIKVDGSAFTQPISGTIAISNFPASQTVNGTVTSNIGTTGGIALDTTSQSISTSVGKLPIAQGASLGTNSQVMSGGSVTTSSPSYTTGQVSPLSLTTAGALRTDSSATTQPISGTVTSNAGTGNFTVVQGTGTNLHTVVDSGSLTANIGTTNGLALDASVAKLNVAQGASLGSNTQALVGASVTTSSPSYTTGQVSPISLTTAGALRVDASATTQPVSGTVAATQSGTWSTRSQDGNGNLLTSQISGSQRALDVGINVSGTQVDPRSIRALTSSDVVTSQSIQSGNWNVSLGNSSGKTVKLLTNNLNTTATTTDQVLLTYTVTSGKTFYLQEFDCNVYQSNHSTTNGSFGLCSLNIGGSSVWTSYLAGAGGAWVGSTYSEAIPISAGTVIQLLVTPAAATSYQFNGNIGGYEK